jgi:hypothetical protein
MIFGFMIFGLMIYWELIHMALQLRRPQVFQIRPALRCPSSPRVILRSWLWGMGVAIAGCSPLGSPPPNASAPPDPAAPPTASTVPQASPTLTPKASSGASPNSNSGPGAQAAKASSPAQANANKANAKASAKASPNSGLTLYKVDSQCLKLEPQVTGISPNQAADAGADQAIAEILKNRDTVDFEISGYRTKIAQGVATVDFRLAPGSKRQFASLSSCEQMAIFATIQKTLTSQSQWGIKSVNFTNQGKRIEM